MDRRSIRDMIGVTKQTISNLENKKTEMIKTQYIAIRVVLDYEMEENPNREILKSAVKLDNVSIENEDDWPQMVKFHAEWSKKFYDLIVPCITVYWQ